MPMNDPWKNDHPTSHLDFSAEPEPAQNKVMEVYAPFFRDPKIMPFEDRECFCLLEEALNGDQKSCRTLIQMLLNMEAKAERKNGLPKGK